MDYTYFMLILSSVSTLWGLLAYSLISFNESPSLWFYIGLCNAYWMFEIFANLTDLLLNDHKELKLNSRNRSIDITTIRFYFLTTPILCPFIYVPENIYRITYYYYVFNDFNTRMALYIWIGMVSSVYFIKRWYEYIEETPTTSENTEKEQDQEMVFVKND